jgi:gelsolin
MAEEEVKFEDTNVAGIGTDEDKAVRKGAASKEPAWNGVGQAPGLNVWRIEQFKVIKWDEDKYGQFHKGDSYIVLSTKADESSGKLIRTIYFWLGKETTCDEQGTAAYKTVELDDFFDGEPAEVRVRQGHEPAEFLALFGGSIELLEGGIDTGFKHVKKDGHESKLFIARRVKGKTEVYQAPLRKSLINENDCYVLDAPDKIYVYDGKGASPFEKQAANAKGENIETERGGKAQCTHDIDGGFWDILGDQ